MQDDSADARIRARAHLTQPQRNGLTFWDSILRGLYAGGRDEKAERYGRKIRRGKPAADESEAV